jgi:heptaprenyl diphosphate synthase
MARKTSRYGVLIALAFILSYIEVLIPINLGVPGVKLGLANLVVFIALYIEGWKGALAISLTRIVLVGFTFSNMFSMIYSVAGGMLSFILMALCKKYKLFSKVGISIVGGVSHNIGQIIVVAFVVNNADMFYYLPVLLVAGAVTGALIGLLGAIVLERLTKVL